MSYVPHTAEDVAAMLATIGVASIDELFALIPPEVRYPDLGLPSAEDETTLRRAFAALQARNVAASQAACFLGGGARRHFVPAAVGHIVGRSEFATAYGLSHSELHQGILQVQYEFQSYVCALTGLNVANATLYDGASATAEAAMMAVRATGRRRVLVAASVHPAYRQVLRTYAVGHDVVVDELPWESGVGTLAPAAARRALADPAAALVVQHPNFLGALEPVEALASATRASGALTIGVVDPVSLALLKPPGQWGADVAVGEGQTLGNGLQGGGPYLGFLAVREPLLEEMPGAVIAETTDLDGRRAFALSGSKARSRNVMREQAKSNVGTVSVLPALAAVVHLALLGPDGLRAVATTSYRHAHHLAQRLAARRPGCLPFAAPFFGEFVVRLRAPAEAAVEALARKHLLAGIPLSRWWPDQPHALLLAATEMNTLDELEALAQALGDWL